MSKTSGSAASTEPVPTTSSPSSSASAPPSAPPAAAAAPASSPLPSQSGASSSSEEPSHPASDADPFYDPHADDADAAWVRRNLGGGENEVRLTCPSCFTLLCVSAQAHVEYAGQWRAVFVRNCVTGGTGGIEVRGADARKDDAFRTVACSHCRTEVAALDDDEVYHFFSVCS